MLARQLSLTGLFAFSLILTSCGGGGSITQTPPPPPPPPPPGPNFTINVQAPQVPIQVQGVSSGQVVNVIPTNGFTGAVTVSLSSLPAGVSTSPAFPVQVTPGQPQYFTIYATAAASAGNTTVTVTGTSGSLTKTTTFDLQISPVSPFQIGLNPSSVSLTPGSKANILLTFTGSQFPPNLALTLPSNSVLENNGLNMIEQVPGPAPNQINLVLSASAAAQPQQNLQLFISSGGGNLSSQAILLVTINSNIPAITALNRSTAVRTDMGVTGVAYDAVHKLVFATVWQLNEVLVFSSVDASLKATIPALLPFGVDISADGSKVYVGSFGANLIEIDPVLLQVTKLIPAPTMGMTGCGPARIVTMSNGKAVVLDECLLSEAFGSTATDVFLWDPVTGTFTSMINGNFSLPGTIARSASHNKAVISGLGPGFSEVLLYDAASDSSTVLAPSDGNDALGSAVLSADGSQIATASKDNYGVSFYDTQMQLLASAPIFDTPSTQSLIYSLDGKTVYSISGLDGLPAAVAIDATAKTVRGVAANPVGGGTPYAIDETGMIFEGTDRGMEFFDVSHPGEIKLPTPFLGMPNNQTNTLLSMATPTKFTQTGSNFTAADQYQIYFGAAPASPFARPGSTPVLSNGSLTTNAPTSPQPGVVNVTVTRSDGWIQIAPDGATYGPEILAVNANAGPREGGSKIYIFGYGLNESGVQVLIGGSAATITQVIGPGFISPFPFPMDAIYLTTPAGAPGLADVTVTTPLGSTTLAGGFQYLASVNQYSAGGELNQIVYDKPRQLLYMSNTSTNAVDVFSLGSNSFLAPIAVGHSPLGLALSGDGTLLAVVNASDGTVSVINPDTSAVVKTYPVLTTSDNSSNCLGVPWQIASAGAHGMVVDVNCTALSNEGVVHKLDLLTGTLGTILLPVGRGLDVLASTPDGSYVAMADAAGEVSVFNPATSGLVQGGVAYTDVAIDATGNHVASRYTIYDKNLTFTGFPEETDYLQAGPNTITDVTGEKLNWTGSLLYVPQVALQGPRPISMGVDIFDVHRQRLAMRIGLPNVLPSSMNAMTLDETGTKIFLITANSLTIVQLQAAPLSIGGVSPTTGPTGTQITIHGSGFTANSKVSIGPIPTITTFVDQNTLQAVIPPGQSGPVQVSVTNSATQSYSYDALFVVQ